LFIELIGLRFIEGGLTPRFPTCIPCETVQREIARAERLQRHGARRQVLVVLDRRCVSAAAGGRLVRQRARRSRRLGRPPDGREGGV
jgi:hypothetical protein